MFSIIHVFDKRATVKCRDILDRTYRLYRTCLFFGCDGARSISDISSLTSEINSDLRCWLDILKSKNLPRYLKDSPIFTVGTGQLLINSFGRFWIDFLDGKVDSDTLINSNDHVRPLAPNSKTVQ